VGPAITINWFFTDPQRDHLLALERSPVNHLPGQSSEAADVSLRLTQATLRAVVLKQTRFAQAKADGLMELAGNGQKLAEFFSMFDETNAVFPIVTPRTRLPTVLAGQGCPSPKPLKKSRLSFSLLILAPPGGRLQYSGRGDSALVTTVRGSPAGDLLHFHLLHFVGASLMIAVLKCPGLDGGKLPQGDHDPAHLHALELPGPREHLSGDSAIAAEGQIGELLVAVAVDRFAQGVLAVLPAE
jgi:hypothetical protein